MIIKKVNIGDEIINVQITKEEALKSLMNNETIIFTDETEKKEIYQLFQDLNEDKLVTHKTELSKNIRSKTSRLSSVLPFLSGEDIRDLLNKVLTNDESLKAVDLTIFLPFIESKDATALFKKAIEGDLNINPSSITPFIDETDLTLIVDAYLNGAHQNLNVDALYPFLDSKDVKRLFEHFLKQ